MAKQGRFVKKKKKSFGWLWILLVLLILGGLGWFFLSDVDFPNAGKPQNETTAPSGLTSTDVAATDASTPIEDNTQPQNTKPTAPAAPETTVPESFELTSVYEKVLNRYHQALEENWEFMECEENQISYMVMFLENLDRLGYYLTDLDSNDVPELIVSDGNVIYDLYTEVDGQALWILSGGERNAYNLCQDGLIANDGSGGAASHVWNFYRLEGNALVLVEALTFEGSPDGVSWKHAEGDGEAQDITEVQATNIIASHRHMPISIIPIP
jgi:hypothetical protein